MTLIVVLILALLLAAGLFVFARAGRDGSGVLGKRVCDECGERNPNRARYCAHCGAVTHQGDD